MFSQTPFSQLGGHPYVIDTAPPPIQLADLGLISIFSDLDGTAQWQAELVKNGWTDALLTGDAFGDFLAEQDHSVDVALQTLGVG